MVTTRKKAMHRPSSRCAISGIAQTARMRPLLTCALLLATAVGCTKAEFVPEITLPEVRPIIDATAEFHDIYPAPALASGKENFGLTGPDAKHVPPRELALHVRNELLDAFSEAGVFSKITTFDREPDLILTGRINALYEHYRPRLWTRVPLPFAGKVAADLLDLKTHATNGEADHLPQPARDPSRKDRHPGLGHAADDGVHDDVGRWPARHELLEVLTVRDRPVRHRPHLG